MRKRARLGRMVAANAVEVALHRHQGHAQILMPKPQSTEVLSLSLSLSGALLELCVEGRDEGREEVELGEGCVSAYGVLSTKITAVA